MGMYRDALDAEFCTGMGESALPYYVVSHI